MKITEQITRAYSLGHWIDDRAAKVLRDALQQAVAENLKAAHELDCQRCSTLDNSYSCSKPDVDWFVEADKLLRGEK